MAADPSQDGPDRADCRPPRPSRRDHGQCQCRNVYAFPSRVSARPGRDGKLRPDPGAGDAGGAVPRMVEYSSLIAASAPGPEPIYWTIANGDREAGITVHLTEPRIDAGPILAQRRVDVFDGETAGSLSKRLVAEGLSALDETLDGLSSGRAKPVANEFEAASYEGPVRQIGIDWDQPFAQIDRLVRAGHPDQPPYFTYRGRRRYIYAVRRVKSDAISEATGAGPRAPAPWVGGPGDEMLAIVRDAVVAVRWQPVGHTHAVRPLAKQQFP